MYNNEKIEFLPVRLKSMNANGHQMNWYIKTFNTKIYFHVENYQSVLFCVTNPYY